MRRNFDRRHTKLLMQTFSMSTRQTIRVFVLLLLCIPSSLSLRALLVSVGAAGHVTPMFELAKAMKNHQVTFLTHRFAQSYIDLKVYSSPSFRVIYSNDSVDALVDEKAQEQLLISYMANQSLFDGFSQSTSLLAQIAFSLVNKTAHVLTTERFDVIVAGAVVIGARALCEKVQTPCVIQAPNIVTNPFEFNLPNTFTSLKAKDLTQLQYRVYNVLFTLRLIVKMLPKLVPAMYRISQSLPQLPEPFSDTFTLKNLLFSKPKCLSLISVPPTFVTPSYSDHYTKFLGTFIDEATGDVLETDLTRWITSKSVDSIVYGAFGSSSLIPHDRMSTLIHGMAKFLMASSDSSVLLAFRSANYDTYLAVINEIQDAGLKDLLSSSPRVRIEPGFVPQKWILQQPSIQVFISHCGMGSIPGIALL